MVPTFEKRLKENTTLDEKLSFRLRSVHQIVELISMNARKLGGGKEIVHGTYEQPDKTTRSNLYSTKQHEERYRISTREINALSKN